MSEEDNSVLYDPARRRGKATAAQMRALRKAWAAKRRKSMYHPAKRRRIRRTRTRRYHPQVRSYRVYHPARRKSYRRRRYDPQRLRGILGDFELPALVTVGSMIHNFLASKGLKIPFLPSTVSVAGVHMSGLGIAGLLGGVGAKYFLKNDVGELALRLGTGMFSEGFSAPAIEGTVKAGVRAAGVGPSSLGGSYIPLNAYD